MRVETLLQGRMQDVLRLAHWLERNGVKVQVNNESILDLQARIMIAVSSACTRHRLGGGCDE